MSEARSKVTRRPRSRLERLLEPLGDLYEVPPRPALDLLSQITLLYLVGVGGDGKRALGAMSPLCGRTGAVDAEKLASTPRELVGSVCAEAAIDDAVDALRAAGAMATRLPDGLDARCRTDLAEGRRLLRSLPRIGEQRADLLLLHAGIHAVVAPTTYGLQVAVRLGYPGTTYASVARALDIELPAPDAIELAWRAHHLLDLHGKQLCVLRAPSCARCPLSERCSFHGEGEDPAAKLQTSARPSGPG